MFKVVIVGCGAMSRIWLSAVSETPYVSRRLDVVGFVDFDKECASKLAAEFGFEGALIGTDIDEVLSASQPDIVFDIVVPNSREAVVQSALSHGCHVLSEKPLATSMAAARSLLDAASKAGKLHAVTQNRRYVKGVQQIKKIVSEKTLGQLTEIHCDFFVAPHFGGFREDMDHVLLLDMAIHTFDAARFMSGEEPTTVFCNESNPNGSWYRSGASASAIFQFSGGVNFSYRGSWCSEGHPTSWDASWRLNFEHGSVVWDGLEELTVQCADKDEPIDRRSMLFRTLDVPISEQSEETGGHGHAGVIEGFLNAIQEGKPSQTSSADNIKSLAMVFHAVESAKTGKRVAINLERHL